MPLPRPATEARSGSLEPGRPSWARSVNNTRHPAGRPHTLLADRMYATDDRRQTDRRQTASSRPVTNSVLLFFFYGQKDLMQMRFTVRCVQCMVTRVLRDQQYTFGVRGLLAAEKALLIRNDLAGMLLRRPMPRLP